jgi:hypothetical protein
LRCGPVKGLRQVGQVAGAIESGRAGAIESRAITASQSFPYRLILAGGFGRFRIDHSLR